MGTAIFKAGGEVVADSDAVFGRAELIVKVKEPAGHRAQKLSRGRVLFTYLHLAPDRQQSEALMAVGVTAIAYEKASMRSTTMPVLARRAPMCG